MLVVGQDLGRNQLISAAVMPGPERMVEVRGFPEPKMEPGAVLLRTLFSEVCGTDVHLHHGRLPGVPYPIIPGHVSVGMVERVQGDVAYVDGGFVKDGDLATFLDVHETCGKCWFCLVAKAPTRCSNRRVYGITYSAEEGLLGGWSEKIYLKPGVKMLKLPGKVSPENFIAGGCGLPTAMHAISRGSIELGDAVAVQGSGPVGLCAAMLAKLSGAFNVIVLGAPERRLKLAGRIGADHVIDIRDCDEEERIQRVLSLTDGRGADITIEATGVPSAVREGMRMTRDAGRYVVVGQYADAGNVEINPHLDINRKHLDLRGCWGTDFSHLYRAVKLVERYHDRFPWSDFITKVYGLNEANQALADVEELKVVKAVIKP